MGHQTKHKESIYAQSDIPPPPPPCGKSSLTLRKHLRRLIFAAAVLFILAACEPPGPTVTPTPAATKPKPAKPKPPGPPAVQSVTTIVSGKVTDTAGDVEAAEISVSVPGVPNAAAPAATGADGTYRLTVKHAGRFTLKAAKAEYPPKTAEVTTKDGTWKHDFTLDLIETLAFESPIIRKSKMLVVTNGNADQKHTNRLLIKSGRNPEGTPVPPAAPGSPGAAYSITEKPAGLTNEITVNPSTGEVSFGRALYDKITPSDITQATGPPQTVTVQAAYQGKTASYTFTVTDHFSPRQYHRSVVLGSDIYVIGGMLQEYRGGRTTIPSLHSDEVWRSGDGGLTWDQAARGTRFSVRNAHGSVVLGNDIYVIAGLGGSLGGSDRNDVWKSSSTGESWTRTAAGVTFPMDSNFASAVLNNTILIMGGLRQSPFGYLDEVWQSSDGTSWSKVTTSGTVFSPRFNASSVVLGSGSAAEVYLIGGYARAPSSSLNDVWKSSDGASWNHVNSATGTTKFPVRSGHTAVAVKDAAGGDILYVIGGAQGSAPRRDVWKSVDRGVNWTRVTAAAQFGARDNHSSVVLGGALYVIGGKRGRGFYNDVWKSDDGATWVNVHKN